MAKSDRKSIRGDIARTFSQLNKVITASLRPLPTETGDGTYVTDPSATTGILKDIGHVHVKDVETLIDVTKSAATGEPVNDREYIMERVIQVREIAQKVTAYLMSRSLPQNCPLLLVTAKL